MHTNNNFCTRAVSGMVETGIAHLNI
jgi:hypothetical protein